MEKEWYSKKLSAGSNYRRVEKTEDDRSGIVYTEQGVKLTVSMPKPIPLIGGTEVYLKDNGTPYWYCRIKEGRDEFMCLYFGDLTEADLFYDENGKQREFTTDMQKEFKANTLKALKNKPKKDFTWIPVYEPSPDGRGNVQYVSEKEVLRNLNSYDWENLFKEYSPENGSQEASITTYFLLALRWLKDGIATLEQLADDSKEIGHYCNSKNAKHEYENTGKRFFGGLFGFVGNTYKIVKDSESGSGVSFVGGDCYNKGYKYPLTDVEHDEKPYSIVHSGVGLLELTK